MDITVSETTIASPSPAKKTKSNEEESTASQSSIYSVAKHFPFNEENGLSCLIKTYDNEEKSDLVLNNVIEVVGFLSLNPALEANWDDADLEDKGTHPPPSLVPRIHAIHVKKLKHCNPLIKENISCGKSLILMIRF